MRAVKRPGSCRRPWRDLARCAVPLGGTVSAEHGLGKRNAHLLALQHAPEHLDTMRAERSGRRLMRRSVT